LLSLKARASHIGGSLGIESSPGQGSRFTLTVPLNITTAAEPRSIVAQDEQQARFLADGTYGTGSAGIQRLRQH
jgi:hypothetical protein